MLPWQKPLIRVREQECSDYLAEAKASGDLDLMEELAAKMADVLIVWRRSQQPPRLTFTDGQIRAMAWNHAVSKVFPELDEEDR